MFSLYSGKFGEGSEVHLIRTTNDNGFYITLLICSLNSKEITGQLQKQICHKCFQGYIIPSSFSFVFHVG